MMASYRVKVCYVPEADTPHFCLRGQKRYATTRLKILQDFIERNLHFGEAAEMLGITPRHCSRLLKRYRQSGALGMHHKSRGRIGNRQLPASLTDLALNIIRERYQDFGPTLTREKLEEVHDLVLGKEIPNSLTCGNVCAMLKPLQSRLDKISRKCK